MNSFSLKNGQLHAESVPLSAIAERFGTPCYIYSRAALEAAFDEFKRELDGIDSMICYAVKANSNLALLNLLARLGSGFDIVSGGELSRVLAAGGDPAKVVFSGVAKSEAEMRLALEKEILCFNLESEAELERLNRVAGSMGKKARVSVRVNPDIDAGTHPYISTGLKQNKFGIPIEQAPAIYRKAAAMAHIEIKGVDCHIGSQLTELNPFMEAADKLLKLIDELAAEGIHIHHLDVGGGLGVNYGAEQPPHPTEYAEALKQKLAGRDLTLLFEPGRAIVANAGVLLTRVEFLKPGETRNFALIDAGMNDLLRPSLYGAWMNIIEVDSRATHEKALYDVVGPVCETGDFLGKERTLAIAEGSLLAVRSAGAYGFTMSSNYNTRPRAAEVLVDGDQAHLIREREQLADLWRGEHLLP